MCCYCVLAIIDFMYNKGIVFFEHIHMERDKEVKEEILLVSVAV